MLRYFIIYKPYHVLSQFSPVAGKKTLADCFAVSKDIYPVGRLDYDSEGLLILTNDTQLNHRLLSPGFKHQREYWVQVEGSISPQALDKLKAGVIISIDGRQYKTLPCYATDFLAPPEVPERYPPIRFRREIPVSWISLVLYEGKNRQVRKMTAAVGFPTLRLLRYRIEKLTTDKLQPGSIKELKRIQVYEALF